MSESQCAMLTDAEQCHSTDDNVGRDGRRRTLSEIKFAAKKIQNKNFKCGIVVCILLVLLVVLIALLCALSKYWIDYKATRDSVGMAYSIEVGIDAKQLNVCAANHGENFADYAKSCARAYNNGSVALLSGLGQPVAPLKLLASTLTEESAAPARAALQPTKNAIRVALGGVYQLDVQLTFVERQFGENAHFCLLLNGDCAAQCNRFLPVLDQHEPASRALATCSISVIWRLESGTEIGFRADAMLHVAADPALTFLRVSKLEFHLS